MTIFEYNRVRKIIGVALGAEIAEKVFGLPFFDWREDAPEELWDVRAFTQEHNGGPKADWILIYDPKDDGDVSEYYAPWRDMADAWKVVEWAQEKFSRWIRFSEALQGVTSFRVVLPNGDSNKNLIAHQFVWRVVTPEDICHAALLVADKESAVLIPSPK